MGKGIRAYTYSLLRFRYFGSVQGSASTTKRDLFDDFIGKFLIFNELWSYLGRLGLFVLADNSLVWVLNNLQDVIKSL